MAETSFKKSTLREYFESIVIAVILAFFIRTFVVQAFKIPTGSMEENLLIGDHLLVNKFAFAPTASPLEKALLPIREVERGDVVVFKYPEEPDRDFIKRVIGLPGETVAVHNGVVSVNGAPLTEPYIASPPAYDGDWVVPEGQLFVLGDNRNDSRDSHQWQFLPIENVIGKAVLIYWPPEQWQAINYNGHAVVARQEALSVK